MNIIELRKKTGAKNVILIVQIDKIIDVLRLHSFHFRGPLALSTRGMSFLLSGDWPYIFMSHIGLWSAFNSEVTDQQPCSKSRTKMINI